MSRLTHAQITAMAANSFWKNAIYLTAENRQRLLAAIGVGKQGPTFTISVGIGLPSLLTIEIQKDVNGFTDPVAHPVHVQKNWNGSYYLVYHDGCDYHEMDESIDDIIGEWVMGYQMTGLDGKTCDSVPTED